MPYAGRAVAIEGGWSCRGGEQRPPLTYPQTTPPPLPRTTALPDDGRVDILLTAALSARGYNSSDLARLCRRQELEQLRRGAYTLPRGADRSPEQQHRDLVLATAAQLRDGAVISHGSAAVLHGLPVWADALSAVSITRSRNYGAKRRAMVTVHAATLRPEDVTTLSGVRVTSLARTVHDLSRSRPFPQAVAAADKALQLGISTDDLRHTLIALERWPGARQARRVAEFADGRSESVGESLSRVQLQADGLPKPALQYEVRSPRGELVGRSDFGWEEQRTLGEFDGRIKYGRLLKPGQPVEDVLFAEKVREDALRDLGWQVVRWTWADIDRPGVLRERLERAFARGRR